MTKRRRRLVGGVGIACAVLLLAWVGFGVKVFPTHTTLLDAKGRAVGDVYFDLDGDYALAIVDDAHPRWFLIGLKESGSLSLSVEEHTEPILRAGHRAIALLRLIQFHDLRTSESFGFHELYLGSDEVRFDDVSSSESGGSATLRFKRYKSSNGRQPGHASNPPPD